LNAPPNYKYFNFHNRRAQDSSAADFHLFCKHYL
jgi:hypothetical protein